MQTLFALFKRTDVNDVPKAYDLTQKHHRVFMALYDVAKPKLHYCMHVIDCWRRHGKLLSCFGAESNHRFSTDVFSFSYRKPCTTALAFDLRRLFQAVCEPRTYQETQLAGTIASWNDYSIVDMGPLGIATIIGSSTELVGPFGRYFKGDLLQWSFGGRTRLGLAECFVEVDVGHSQRCVAILEELGHKQSGVWGPLHTSIVCSSLLVAAIPFVSEDNYVRPVYVTM